MSRSIASLLVAAALVAASCARKEAAPPPPQRVQNAQLGIALLALPEGFTVAANQGDRLVLRPTAENDPARLYIEVGPLQPGGIDLVQWVQAQQPDFEAKPGGKFFGSKKLSTPIGTAYTARGRWRGGHGEIEETRVLAVDPSAPRLLVARYVYPAADDTATRVQQLLDVFAEIEPLPLPTQGTGGS